MSTLKMFKYAKANWHGRQSSRFWIFFLVLVEIFSNRLIIIKGPTGKAHCLRITPDTLRLIKLNKAFFFFFRVLLCLRISLDARHVLSLTRENPQRIFLWVKIMKISRLPPQDRAAHRFRTKARAASFFHSNFLFACNALYFLTAFM